MTIILLILTVLLVIAFFFFLWKSADRWGVTQLVFAPLVFIMALILIPFVGMAMKARIAWQETRTELQDRLENAEETQKQIKYGVGAAIEGQPALVPLQIELHELRADAGRVWRRLALNDTANGYVLSLPRPQAPPGDLDAQAAPPAAAAPPAGADAQPPTPAIPEGLVVYAFAEQQGPGGIAVPRFYLGDFQVTTASPTQVTLQPMKPLPKPVLDEIASGNTGRWTLYEVMPVDSHQAFIAPGSKPTPDALFGRVDENLVRRLLEGKVSPQTLDRYLRDGSRARQDDPPETLWSRVEFTTDYEIVVDSPEQRNALDGGYFDGAGQAVDSRLQRGEAGPVAFDRGDTLVVKQEAAEELIADGVARLIDTYFVRPLNDYRFGYQQILGRLDRLNEKEKVVAREIRVLRKAHDLTVEMVTRAQEDQLKLERDLAQYRKEREAIAEYVDKLDNRIGELRTQMASLYRSNLEMARDLEAAQQILEARIEQREAAVVEVN